MCAVAGIVIACVSLTGLGLKLFEAIVDLVGEKTFLILVMSRFAWV